MAVVTAEQMRALEARAVERGETWAGLMEQAGTGVAQVAIGLLQPGRRVLVLVGPGNNGGDGLVVARRLAQAGFPVKLYIWRRSPGQADENWRRCRELSIPETLAEADPDHEQLARLLDGADLAIDALLGSGVSRPVEGNLAHIVTALNMARRKSRLLVLAIDLPTGVTTDTGAIGGVAVRADHTVATGLVKYGLLLYPGRAYAGELHVVGIGLTDEDLAPLERTMSDQITASSARSLLPERPADAHKYTFGKVLAVAGSPQYPGAASLAAAGAARVGAGLVCLAAGRTALGGPGRLAEITYLVLPEAEWGTLGEAAADELLKKIGDYKALLIGPGLGREKPTRRFLERLLGLDAPKRTAQIGFRFGAAAATAPETPSERPELPAGVLDADALSMLALPEEQEEPARRGDFFQRTAGDTPAEAVEENSWWEHLPAGRFVLTPHAGEMARLLGVEKIDSDHAKVAADASARWKQIVVLKGPTTVVAHPEGRLLLHDGANPALATAGTGDVLTGAIAGLIAQGLSPFDAAALGVYLHGAAGRLVADDLGDMGAIASDLLPRLPLAIKELRAGDGQ